MSVMDRVAGVLADAGDLLQDADDLTVGEALSRGEAPAARDWRAELSCDWCGHGWHGLGCYNPPRYDRADWYRDAIRDEEGAIVDYLDTYAEHLPQPNTSCHCDGSLVRLDDTWRPSEWEESRPARRTRQLAAQYGLDGWAADALRQKGWAHSFSQPTMNLRDAARLFAEAAQSAGQGFQQIADGVLAVQLRFIDVDTLLERLPPEPSRSAVLERARRTRGTGPARPGPERSRRPRRVP